MTLRELWLRLTYPFWKRAAERDLRDEMRLHLELRAKQLVDEGQSDRDARLAARRQFGNVARIVQATRDGWGWRWLDGAGQDLRFIVRQLRRSPGFTLVAVLTMALGIALNAMAFTFYDAIVLKPLPVRSPERMVRVVQDVRTPTPELVPFAVYDALQRARTLDAAVLATGPQSFAAVLPGRATADARVVAGRFVSPSFARVLGLRASVGRWFDETDDDVAVLDHEFWTNVLGADPAVVGRRIDVHGVLLTIVGVAPAGFAGTGLPAAAPDLWLPSTSLEAILRRDWRYDGRNHWQVLGRLASTASLAQFQAELAGIRQTLPDSAGKPLPLIGKHATFFQTDAGEFEVFQQASVAFMVALALVLAIAGANLVNLFAARNAARETEATIRLALGASRLRLARQLAFESLLIAAMGGALGLGASRALSIWLRSWLMSAMSSVTGGLANVFLDLSVDWRVVAYTAALSCAIGLVVGLWPALHAAKTDVNGVLRRGSGATAGTAAWAKRNALLVIQVASCLVLLTTAGTLVAGLRLAPHVDPHFDAEHILVAFLDDANSSGAERVAVRAEIERRLAALPEVRAVAWSRRVPFAGTHLRGATTPSGRVAISIENVSGTYFDAMGLDVARGRAFTKGEVETNAPVMLVSETLARRRWPAGDAVGKSIPINDILSGPDTTRPYTVIGVVRDVNTNFLSRTNSASAYYPHALHDDFGAFLVRTRGAPASALNAVRLALAGISPLVASEARVVTMESGPMALQRLMAQAPAVASLGLAVTGLVLATVGVFGLISTIVTRRTREIGVYMALGARPAQVIALVVRRTMRPVLWGVGFGGVGAVGVALLLRSVIAAPDTPDLTFGAGAFNPVVFLGVLATLGVVVCAACYLPARRATRVDPTVALRME